VEIDINTSKDDVMYLFHGPALERTTDGSGLFYEMSSTVLDTLDCGSWFSPEFKNERIPRLETFLPWFKEKAKVYFDVKRADHQQLIGLVYTMGLENKCFFWSSHHDWSAELKQRAPELPVKFNARDAEGVRIVHEKYKADIVEIGLNHMSKEIKQTCRDLGIKIMIYHQQNDPEAFRQIIDWDVEMLNLNHADAFISVAREMGVR